MHRRWRSVSGLSLDGPVAPLSALSAWLLIGGGRTAAQAV